MARGIVLDTIDAGDLNPASGAYTSFVQAGQMRPQTGDVKADRVGRGMADPIGGAVSREGRNIVVYHQIGSGGDGFDANIILLKKLYAPEWLTQTLAFTLDGIELEARVRLIKITPVSTHPNSPLQGEWELLSSVYYAPDEESTTENVTTSPSGTIAIVSYGTVPSRMGRIELEANAAKDSADGQRYRKQYTIVPTAPRGGRHPVEITGSGFAHATEAAASRSLASGDDVAVLIDDVPTLRWPGAGGSGGSGWNSATTRVWVEMDLHAKRTWTLTAALDASQTTAQVKETIEEMPPAPFIATLDLTEPVLVTDYDARAKTMTIVRGQRGVSSTTHAAGDLMHLAIGVDLVYGDLGAAAVQQDDRLKPAPASHASSTNAAWTYGDYMEAEQDGLLSRRYPRLGSWEIIPMTDTDRKDIYWKWVPWTATLGTNANPATAICIGYRDAGAAAGQPLSKGWRIRSIVGISQFDYTSDTDDLTMGPGSPPQEGRMEVWATLSDGTRIRARTIENEAATAHTDTFAVPALDIAVMVHPWDPTNTEYNTSDGVAALKPADNDGLKVSGAVLTFDTDERIQVIAGARQDIYQWGEPAAPASVVVTDDVGGTQTLYLHGLVAKLSEVISFDIETGAVTRPNGERVGPCWRGVIPMIPPGTPSAVITDDGASDFDITFSWKPGWS